MSDIISFAILGMLAGAIAGFWTRIIRESMIFSFIGEWIAKINKRHILATGRGENHWLCFLLCCIFCITPWIAFVLDLYYIITYTPAWYLCVIGVVASLGTGNFIAEVIYGLRGQE